MDWDAADEMHDIRQDERQEKPMSDAAQILAAHRLVRNDGELRALCTCGWESEPARVLGGKHEMHEAHVLAVLSETHEVVELPEGDDLISRHRMSVTLPHNGKPRFQPIAIDLDDEGERFETISITTARERATAYLSAARVAEATQ